MSVVFYFENIEYENNCLFSENSFFQKLSIYAIWYKIQQFDNMNLNDV